MRVGAANAPLPPTAYQPRAPEKTLLYQLVHQHLETMLAQARAQTDHGFGYPRFIERNFRNFLDCGQLSRGFARIRCKSCGYERLLPFSCKSRICPSCHARRMHDTAFHLEQDILPRVPWRQWVMTFPRHIRLLMARDRTAIGKILSIFIRTLFAYQRRLAKKDGYLSVLPGGVTFVQTFGSAVNLNIHFHTLLMDGVFIDTPPEQPITFLELPFPSQKDVETLLLKIASRVHRFVQNTQDDAFDDDPDPCALATAQTTATMFALPRGPRRQCDDFSDQATSDPSRHRCASADGFSLHANVALAANDRKGLIRLVRYGARQAFSQDRLTQLPDGRVRYELARPWGRHHHITLEPTALLHRLAAVMPAPYLHLTRYHGCFAPNANRRCEVINLAFRRKAALPSHPHHALDDTPPEPLLPLPEPLPRSLPWAQLLAKTFKTDVLKCPTCGDRLSIIAFITDLVVVRKILAHLAFPTTIPLPAPARLPEQLEIHFGDSSAADSEDLEDPMPSPCRDPP